MSKTVGTVCFILSKHKVLLAEIEYPDGKRLWNGIGGVVDVGETPLQAVCREIAEETELVVNEPDLVEAAVIQIGALELHVFTANKWSGSVAVKDPSVRRLQWFDAASVPYSSMHPGSEDWLPDVLQSSTK